MIRPLRPVLLLALAALLCRPAPARAQAPPSGEERPTMKIGPFELRPRLLFNNIGVDNNVFNESENPKRDFTFGAQPDLEVTVRPGRAKIVWLSGTEFIYYHRYKSERAVNRSQTVSADVDLNFLRPFASYSTADTTARSSMEIDSRARRHPETWAVGSSVKLASRTGLTFAARGGRDAYDENIEFRGQELAETLNKRTRTYEGSLDLVLTPMTTFRMLVARDEMAFDEATERNSTATRIAPTFAFNPNGIISGNLSAGYKKLTGDDPSFPGYTGLAVNGSVAVIVQGRHRLETRLTRDVQYSYEETLPYYVVTGGRGTWATQVTDLIDLRVTGGRDEMKYRAFGGGDVPGGDSMDVYGGGIGFRLGDRRRLVIQGEFTRRRSERSPDREFENHRVFATLTWGA